MEEKVFLSVMYRTRNDMMSNHFARDCKTYLGRVELDTSLDDIDWSKSSVCKGTADTTGGSSLKVVHQVILGPVVFGRGQKDGSGCRGSGRHGGKMVVVRVVGIVGM